MATALRSCLLLAVMLATLHVIPAKIVKPNSNQQATSKNPVFETPSVLAVDQIPLLKTRIAFLEGQVKSRDDEIKELLVASEQMISQIKDETAVCDARVTKCETNSSLEATKCKQEQVACESASVAKQQELQRQINALTAEKKALASEIVQLKNEIQELKQRLLAAENNLQICTARSNVLTSEISTIKTDCKKNTTALQNENARLDQIIQKLNASAGCSELKQQIAALNATNQNLNTEIATCNKNFKNNVTALQNENLSLKNTIVNLNTQIQTCNTNSAALQAEVNQHKQTIAQLDAQISSCLATSSALRNESAALKVTNADLNSKVTACASKVASLENQVSSLQATIAQLNAQISAWSSKAAALQTQVNELQGSVQKLNADIALCNTKTTNLQNENAVLKNANQKLSSICSQKGKGLSMTTFSTGKYYFSYAYNNYGNWYDSLAFCNSYGLDLVSIESQHEQQLLSQEASRLTGNRAQVAMWTGGNDLSTNGKYTWISTGKPITYFSWVTNANEPANSNTENCLNLWNNQAAGFNWSDGDCFFKLHFICEMPASCL